MVMDFPQSIFTSNTNQAFKINTLQAPGLDSLNNSNQNLPYEQL